MSLHPRWAPLVWSGVTVVLLLLAIIDQKVSRVLIPWGRRRRLMSTLLACVVGAGIGAGLWQAYLASRPPQAFGVGVRSAMIYDRSEKLSLFMVAYQSMYGPTASPVYYLANIQIVNLQATPRTVEGYAVAVADSPSGPWEDLAPIPLTSARLYALGAGGGGSGGRGIVVPRGAYRLGTPMQPKDLTVAAPLAPSPTLEAALAEPVGPNATIGGWAAFDVRNHERTAVQSYFRITVRDSVGATSMGVVALPRANVPDTETDTQAGRIMTVGPAVDLSDYHLRYYSDPYSSPAAR